MNGNIVSLLNHIIKVSAQSRCLVNLITLILLLLIDKRILALIDIIDIDILIEINIDINLLLLLTLFMTGL